MQLIHRRAFLATIGAGMAGAPLLSQAQQAGRIWRIGLFHVGLDHIPPSLDGLRDGLRALGYEEGKNLQLDFRNCADEAAARAVAVELVRHRPDVLVAFENQTLRAAKAATSDIPIVFLHVTDPVAAGVIKSLAHPGGNMTGFVALGNAPTKELELFRELVPTLRRLLVLSDPSDPGAATLRRKARQAAAALKFELIERDATTAADIERIFESVTRASADGVYIASLNLRTKFHALIVRLGTQRRLPIAGHRKEWVEQGALFSYAENIREVGREAAARYVDKILKGVKPGDLPAEAYERPELAINLKTAKALGLTIPQSLLLRADQVIQ
jgi:putative ABC transport system substrate-binding protein